MKDGAVEAGNPGLDISRMHFPAGLYDHPPNERLQLRVVRSGSSYADIDLGAGAHRVFTRPGDLLLSLPGRATSFRIDEGRELTFLTIDPGLAGFLLHQAGGTIEDLAPVADRPLRDPMVAEICRRLDDEPGTSAVVRQWSVGVALAALLEIARAHRTRKPVVVLSQRRLDAVLAVIDSERDSVTTVAHLAGVAEMPRRAFASAFREATGMPVHQFVLQRRVDRAAALLGQSDLSLAEVAQRAGFSHQAHMTRVMSRLKGRTPGQLRSAASKAD